MRRRCQRKRTTAQHRDHYSRNNRFRRCREQRSLSRRSLLAATAGIAAATVTRDLVGRKRPRQSASANRHAGQHHHQPAARLVARPPVDLSEPRRCSSSISSFTCVPPGNPARSGGCGPGAQWAEGVDLVSQGQYLVFSDVSGNTQYRPVGRRDGRAVPQALGQHQRQFVRFRGRQLSCEDFNRRVVRGSMTARSRSSPTISRQALNSPNDIVPHPDGSILVHRPALQRPRA